MRAVRRTVNGSRNNTSNESNGDEESLLKTTDQLPPPPPRTRQPSSQNPATTMLRKILSIFILDNGNTNRGIVGFYHDLIIGTAMALILIVLLVFLDLLGVVRLQSMRTLWATASSNPEARQNLEDMLDLKFIPVEEYNHHLKEIADVESLLELNRPSLEEKTLDLKELNESISGIQAEKEGLLQKLGMQKFCGGCKTRRGVNCNARLAYVKEKYGTSDLVSKFAILRDEPTCKST